MNRKTMQSTVGRGLRAFESTTSQKVNTTFSLPVDTVRMLDEIVHSMRMAASSDARGGINKSAIVAALIEAKFKTIKQ